MLNGAFPIKDLEHSGFGLFLGFRVGMFSYILAASRIVGTGIVS